MRRCTAAVVSILLVLLFSFTFISSVQSAIIRVSPNGNNYNNGSSWILAKRTITSGMSAAVANDEIWVAAGVYQERVIIKPAVVVYGGFDQTELQRDQRNWKANKTVIEAPSAPSNPAVVIGAATTSQTRIDGFTIKKLSHSTIGGGIACCGYAVITNNTIDGCQATNGGGIYCTGNYSPVITDNIIKGNTADNSGGGIFCLGSSAIIKDNVIYGNRANGYNSGTTMGGGGIYCNGPATISNNTITGNEAVSRGGGLLITGLNTVVADNIIAANVVLDNYANGSGYGGGICCNSPSAKILNNTLVYNISPNSGGGIYCGSSSPSIANNILAFNSTGVGADGGAPNLHNNCFYEQNDNNYIGISPGEDDISADPGFTDEACGNFRLKPGSACIDSGFDEAVLPDINDMDGKPRLYGSNVDIGAYEADNLPLPAKRIVYVNASTSPGGDGTTWERAFRTIQAGANDAARYIGSEIWVAKGVYPEHIQLAPFTSVYGGFTGNESSKARDWRNNRTIIDKIADDYDYYYSVESAGGATIEGFTMKNGLRIAHGRSTIRNNIITCLRTGIEISNGEATIENNRICCVSGYGIILFDAHCTIKRNTILGCNMGVAGYYSGIVSNNVVSECLTGINCSQGPVVVTNNTVAGSSSAGISIYGSGAEVRNNIVAYCGNGIACTLDEGNTPISSNNDLFGNGANYYIGSTPGTNDIFDNPGFASREFGDFHIQPDSKCIGKGDITAQGIGELDIDGNPRIVNGKIDIGAYQSDGSTHQANGRIIYVNAHNAVSGDGTSWLQAYKALTEAMDDIAINGCAEVWVAAGIYTENIWATPFSYLYGGFTGTETTREGRNWKSNTTTIEGSEMPLYGPYPPWGAVNCNGLCSIDGFTLQNARAGVMVENGSVNIHNNTITGNNHGIFIFNGSASILGNTINQNALLGIYLTGHTYPIFNNNEVVSNVVTKNGRDGIRCTVSNLKAVNNIVAGNNGIGVNCGQANAQLINNTVVNNNSGIYISWSESVVANNIVAFNATSGIEVDVRYVQQLSTVSASFNDVYGNATDYLNVSRGKDISSDPLFVDRENNDYHIRSESPCVNAGSNYASGLPSLDVDGEKRIYGGAVDIGADENQDAPMSIPVAKKAENGTLIAGKRMPVTAVFPDFFYIESDNRCSGIRITKPEHGLWAGSRVDVDGTVSITPDGEKCVIAASATPAGSANVLPVYMNNFSIGGGVYGLQDAVWNWKMVKIPNDGSEKLWLAADGINTTGLFVKVCGQIRQVDPNGEYFYIDDGSVLSDGTKTNDVDNIGIRVAGDGRSYEAGEMVSLVGISSCFMGDDGKLRRLVRVVSMD